MNVFRPLLLAGLCSVGLAPAWGADPAFSPESIEFFERQIRPILAEHCWQCHGEKKQEAALRLDSREAILRGSDGGPIVTPGNPAASKLVSAVEYADENLQMPPDRKLPPEAVAALTQWVAQSLPWPASVPSPAAVDPASWKSHWAFQPVHDPPPPVVKRQQWVQSPVDNFVLARLEAAGLDPAPPADRRTLLRRVSFDLTGLPPTAEEVDAFVADTSADAWSKVVERLLASPAYGERWGRYWLDHARYADTKGYVFEEDRKYPFAYKYRDWVVRSINEDLPYDQFLLQQIAADRLPGNTDPNRLAAMGFLTVGRRFLNNQADIIDDRLDVLCRTTMGLTVACARCHDHKFDPISAKDYYSLYGVFSSTVEPKDPAELMSMADSPQPHNVRVFIRGNPGNLGDEAPRRFLSCLAGDNPPLFTQGSGRFELAEQIVSRENPLTARVMVNRVWLHYFGTGLVRTPSDFGMRSDPPTHPELLDFLARRFMDGGWSLKSLHRLLVSSSTYQQASNTLDQVRERDPENRLYAHVNRRRLDLEALRDAILKVAGTLDPAVGGPAVDLNTQPFSHRRTIYGLIERQNLPGMFRTFDFAGPDAHSPQRFVTTVPQQALFLMNSPFVQEQVHALSSRPEVQSVDSLQERAVRLYRLVLGRSPEPHELQLATEYVQSELAGSVPPSQIGYGEWDADQRQLKNFVDLPYWTGSMWQGAADHPDAKLGYLELHDHGGHTGAGSLATVRRWHVPQDGTVSIGGLLEHKTPGGDGVEAHIVSSRQGALGNWVADHGQATTNVDRLEVHRGDTIDFVVTCRGDNSFDGYAWSPVVRPWEGSAGPSWDAQADFHGPLAPRPEAWIRLAQVLLLTNDFAFLD